MQPSATCSFTGHRILPRNKLSGISRRLDEEVDALFHAGITDFISGGALGFDQLAASIVAAKKAQGYPIRLIFALPCKNQGVRWTAEQRRRLEALLLTADETIYVSEKYSSGCMQKRNRYMIDHSTVCLCALLHPRSGTGQCVRYAALKGVRVINVAEDASPS